LPPTFDTTRQISTLFAVSDAANSLEDRPAVAAGILDFRDRMAKLCLAKPPAPLGEPGIR
jgi:hypothetical protein